MRKICIVITARASYSRIKTVLEAIKAHPSLDYQIVVTSSALLGRFGNIIPHLRAAGFEIAGSIANLMEVESLTSSAKTTGLAVIELATFFANHRPDMVITIADRFETIATAIAAINMNVPLVHIQGGEVTGSIDDKIRNGVTQLADLHFVATEQSKKHLIGRGIPPARIHCTGCPSIDLVHHHEPIHFDPYDTYGGVGAKPDLHFPYLVVLQHPVTTEAEHSRWQIECTLEAIEALKISTIWFWPNADPGSTGISQGIRAFRERNVKAPVHFFKHMESAHFLALLKKCACLIGNSSVGIREGSSMGIPVVNIGSRQCGRERSTNVVDCKPETGSIISAVRYQLAHGPYEPVHLYGNGDAGTKIARLLATTPLIVEKHVLPAL
nr:UDP-N-acetylglucosamine 2-epimerase [uncultured Dyadobacter sp.]